MMITHYALHYKNRILQSFLIITLGLFCYAFARNIITINDDITPLSGGNVEAMFYIENPDTGSMTCIGDGLIKNPSEIYNDEASVFDKIVSSPNYKNYLPVGTHIVWKTINILVDEYRVIGYVTSNEISTSISLADYGAVGDGVTDNYSIFQKAINDAIANKQSLYIPSGTFYLSKKIVIPSSATIKGSGPNSTIILFKDITESSDYMPFLQRGLIAIKGSNINIEDISFKYEATKETKYTREMFKPGVEGVLVLILDSSNIHFKNTSFNVLGELNPSVTCLWAKSETTGIKKLSFEDCIFDNQTEAGVGGGLWISAYDNKDSVLDKVDIKNCKFFKKGHDEPLAFWGFNMSNINISNNVFEYSSATSYMQTMIAIGSLQDMNRLTNCNISNNTINLNDNVATVIGVRNLSTDSNVNISNNTIIGNIPTTRTIDCFALNNCGNVNLIQNNININGGSTTSYLTYDKGGIVHSSSDTATFSNCNCWLLIKSTQSINFKNGELYLNNDIFNVLSNNTQAGISTVQFPLSSKLEITNTSIDTSSSKIHEIVFQTLESTYMNNPNNDLTLQNFKTDAEIFYNISNLHNERKISLNDVVAKNVYFSFFNKGTLEQVDINSCTYSNLYFNYKKIRSNNTTNNFVSKLTIN